MRLGDLIQLETVTGQPVAVGELSFKPQSQVLRLHFPWGGAVLNRPVAVVVEDGQQEERVPIVDVTRVAQIALLASAGLFVLLGWRARLRDEGGQRQT